MPPPDSLRQPARRRDWLPGLDVLRNYQREWLRQDIVAGLVVTTMLVPVGIAYAEASGIPGINGLYATIVPLLAYALVGPSRIIVLGPDSALAPLILAVVAPLAGGDAHRAVALGSAMAIVAGLVCLAAGLARLGFITELLSKPIRYGYMNGIALTVILSQVPKLLGFRSQRRAAEQGAASRGSRRTAGRTGPTFASAPDPRGDPDPEAMASVPGTWSRSSAQPSRRRVRSVERAGVEVLGELPRGLPAALPVISMSDVAPIVMAA